MVGYSGSRVTRHKPFTLPGWSDRIKVSQVRQSIIKFIMQLNIYEAKSKLSNLLDRAIAGETVVIARAGEPLVRLVPVKSAGGKSGVIFGGALAGKIKLKPGFFAPLTDDDLLA